MKIFLLTHERELLRASNTGALATSLAPEIVERVIWQRNTPSEAVLEAIRCERTVLLYPLEGAATEAAPLAAFDSIILLDATWQEARKMFNKSPYLKDVPKAHIKPQTVSQYQLRRNQPNGGLCTAECVIEILRARNQIDSAQRLEAEFAIFNSKITRN
jgi:DTW domain-containing protein